MKKHVFGRQFKRDANERKALFKNLLTSLVLVEKIETTEAKAKAIKGDADKLITKAKIGGTHAFRMLEAKVNHNAVVKLLEDLGPRFAARNGGYTRIIKTRRRVADNAPMVILEWVERASSNEKRKMQSAEGEGQSAERSKEKKGKKEVKEPKEKKVVKKETEGTKGSKETKAKNDEKKGAK